VVEVPSMTMLRNWQTMGLTFLAQLFRSENTWLRKPFCPDMQTAATLINLREKKPDKDNSNKLVLHLRYLWVVQDHALKMSA